MNGRKKEVSAWAGVPVMIREIYQNYHLPMMPQSLTLDEIRFWYDPLIPSLIKMQSIKEK